MALYERAIELIPGGMAGIGRFDRPQRQVIAKTGTTLPESRPPVSDPSHAGWRHSPPFELLSTSCSGLNYYPALRVDSHLSLGLRPSARWRDHGGKRFQKFGVVRLIQV